MEVRSRKKSKKSEVLTNTKNTDRVISLELSGKIMKRILGIIVLALVVYWSLNTPRVLKSILSGFLGVISPFLIGLCIAFVINVIMNPLESLWDNIFSKTKKNIIVKLKRPSCLVLAIICVIGIISAMFFVIIPEFKETLITLGKMLPRYVSIARIWIGRLADFLMGYGIELPEFDFTSGEILEAVKKYAYEQGQEVVDATFDVATSIFTTIANVVIAFVFSVYVLAQKEKLGLQVKKVMFTFMKKEKAKRILYFADITNRCFTNFVTGQVTEAVIIGFLCFIGMLILNIPYSAVISVLVGFTALIPVFGAFIGTAIGAFLILFISPVKTLWFIIFILVLQQFEGNVIYPKIVGKSVGLPGIWVLVAVTVGGGFFGFVGMLLSVPVFAVVYTVIKEKVSASAEADSV